MKYICIIPSRYDSARFPGKPLADLDGKPLILRVLEQASKFIEEVVVATDDQRIETVVKNAGGHVLMTDKGHKSGTDRCAEAARILHKEGKTADVIINIQGDEPFIREEHIKLLMQSFENPRVDITTLANPIKVNDDIFSSNNVKVITDIDWFALYFSRSPIPYLRKTDRSKWYWHFPFLKHMGIYAYRYQTLQEITKLPQSPLELAESLEQNRWLENGFHVKVSRTDLESFSIDAPGDLKTAKKLLANLNKPRL